MNKVIEVGRLTRNPEIRYTQGAEPMAIARYTLAVDRRQSRNNDNQQSADFIPCVAFGKLAEFAEKYLAQGVKIVIEGHLQSGSYTNKDGIKVHTIEVLAEGHDFAGRKNTGMTNVEPPKEENGIGQGSSLDTDALISGHKDSESKSPDSIPDGFTDLPEDEDDVLPFN